MFNKSYSFIWTTVTHWCSAGSRRGFYRYEAAAKLLNLLHFVFMHHKHLFSGVFFFNMSWIAIFVLVRAVLLENSNVATQNSNSAEVCLFILPIYYLDTDKFSPARAWQVAEWSWMEIRFDGDCWSVLEQNINPLSADIPHSPHSMLGGWARDFAPLTLSLSLSPSLSDWMEGCNTTCWSPCG